MYAKDRPDQVGIVLAGLVRVARHAAVANRQIEVTIGSEQQASAVVIALSDLLVDIEHDRLIRCHHVVAYHGQSRDP